MILYHLTKRRYATSILAHGIKPGYRKGLTLSDRKQKSVFVTNDINKIVQWQSGKEWCEKHDAVVFEIDMNDVQHKPVEYWSGGTYTISDFEFTTTKIKTDQIIKVQPYKKYIK